MPENVALHFAKSVTFTSAKSVTYTRKSRFTVQVGFNGASNETAASVRPTSITPFVNILKTWCQQIFGFATFPAAPRAHRSGTLLRLVRSLSWSLQAGWD
jgi:hypothetical protein